jgi:hypothetical protein
VWGAKYSYDYWRPITAIRENDPGSGPTGLGSGNPFLIDQGDPKWQPFGAPAHDGTFINFTPPFPSYTSGHAGIGGSMFAIMTDFYGRDDVPFTAYTDEFNTLPEDQYGNPVPLGPRSFSRFSEAAEENGQSRIYLGIHYQFDKTEGISQGYYIGDYIFQNALMPVGGSPGGSGAPIAGSILTNVLQPLWATQMAPWEAEIGATPILTAALATGVGFKGFSSAPVPSLSVAALSALGGFSLQPLYAAVPSNSALSDSLSVPAAASRTAGNNSQATHSLALDRALGSAELLGGSLDLTLGAVLA